MATWNLHTENYTLLKTYIITDKATNRKLHQVENLQIENFIMLKTYKINEKPTNIIIIIIIIQYLYSAL